MVVQIPQRFIAVHGLSPFSAAIRLMSFGVFVPVSSAVAAVLMGRLKIPPCWIVLFGSILQVAGTVLLAQLDDYHEIRPSQYGFQIIAGTGVGFVNAALTLLVPYVMDKRDLGTWFPKYIDGRMPQYVLTLYSYWDLCHSPASGSGGRGGHFHCSSNFHTLHSNASA